MPKSKKLSKQGNNFIISNIHFFKYKNNFIRTTRLVVYHLQNDLDTVYKWTEDNNMQLNGLKFEHLAYGKNDALKQSSRYFTDTATLIENKDEVKDLGVTLDTHLTYEKHIQEQIKKVKNISAWIYRTFKSREIETMLTLWKALAIPHLDYCSQLWSPWKRGLVQQLEEVQKSFLHGIPSLRHLNYWEKLKSLKLYSLERRRERYQIIYTWNVIEGNVPNFDYDESKGGISCHINQRLGRICNLKAVNIKHKNIWRGSLSQEGPRLFNTLPRPIRDLTNCPKEVFKKHLDTFLKTVPDEPLLAHYFNLRQADSNSLKEMLKHRTQRVG
uniref:Uncharacterized protein n=1 Tax=Clytia hemisphaerica TaxID=252671 RepID=A0A7M5V1G6_9CNID